MKKILFLCLSVIVLAGAVSCKKKEADSGKIKAIFIAMDSVDEHWLKAKAGCEDKAKELGNVDFTFNAPQGKLDAASQLQLVEDAITRKVQILLLAPLNKDALAPGVEKAKAAGIKVIIIDSPIGTENYDAFLSTDNGAAARLAADEMAKLIGNTGKIAIINAQAGAGTAMIRENDFKAQITAKYPDITIVGTQYSDGDKTKALNIGTDFMTANPDLAGIYACNEGSTVGAGQAIEQRGKSGAITLVGWDWTGDTKALVERGVLNASMVQNPYQMGYQGIQVGADLIGGKTAQKSIDTGVTVVNKDNMNSIK
ncbi:MAG: ABC transporter substrate-binding protein [Spirochaetaceae bacterium]|jgi:ribose transport system substrate-binding protein|nr:ABC transporter substrate-binding protein [Spirochaetaceae bacterium]